jgi:uncharacterized protein (TIGR02147 family)
MSFIVSQRILHTKLDELKSINPQFSLRAFAKRIEVSPATLSGFLKGKRPISKKMAERISEKISLSPIEKKDFLWPFLSEADDKVKKKLDYCSIDLDTYESISKWYHYGILSLIETKDFIHDPDFISQRLNISRTVVDKSVKRLVRLGILTIEDGKFRRAEKRYQSSDDVLNQALSQAQINNMELAIKSQLSDNLNDRDITSMTMPINIDKFPIAKKLIRKFQDDLSELLEDDNKSEVYKLNIQLFPLSKRLP